MNIKHFLWILGLLLLSACKKDNAEENPIVVSDSGKLNIVFNHTIDNQALQLNTNIYINEAGNHYELTDVRYFISDVTLYTHNGTKTSIKLQTRVHYTDIQLPSTLSWEVYDPIPTGIYDSISFIFGLNEQLNQSSAFVNAPESNMAWPAMLGGGYHYMMMNGKWMNPQNIAVPFNFHLGIGQIYSDTINYDVNTITGFVQNYFNVVLPTALQISKNMTTSLHLNMAVDSWFKTPHTWDHNYWGGSVMQNQRALQSIKENGFDVFSITKK
ncbi:MAG: MbnP family protein [Bacteroidales bacterium]